MNRIAVIAGLAAVIAAAGAIGQLRAAADRIPWPEGFAENWVLYNTVDRPDRQIIRYMYVNPEAFDVAAPGEPAPDGTVLVMADRGALLDANGVPILDEIGRFIPEGDFRAIFVMEKHDGWGETLGLDVVRNGDWDYARFNVDGTLIADANTTGCFACHANRSEADFTFTFFRNVIDLKR